MPRNVDALNNLATCFIELESYERSEHTLKTALDIDPDFAGAWYNLGITSKRQDNYEDAILF